jgi:hypothetical protein
MSQGPNYSCVKFGGILKKNFRTLFEHPEKFQLRLFSLSLRYRDNFDQNFVIKSKYCVRNKLTESNYHSKSGLRSKIQQPHPEILKFSCCNSCKIAIFVKNCSKESIVAFIQVLFLKSGQYKAILIPLHNTVLKFMIFCKLKRPEYTFLRD